MESMEKEEGGVDILRLGKNSREELDEDESGSMSWLEWLGDSLEDCMVKELGRV